MPKPGWIAALLLAAALAGGSQAQAQVMGANAEPYTQAELDQLLAHVALYPDELLSHVLIAATYPLEIVEAARWTRRNPGLSGDAAVAAAAEQGWAPAVTALVAFPEILQRMDEDLDWTRRLGDALLVQEAQVMDTVQALRQRAWSAGSLDRLEHVTVRREREVIYIEPVRREVVYVPYYNPAYVYGPWWHPAHPPWFWTPAYWGPGFRAPATFYSGVTFWWGSGITVSTGFLFSQPDWYRRHLVVVRVPAYPPRHRAPARMGYRGYQGWAGPGHRWRHDPYHRRGVAYSRPLPPRHVAPGQSPRVVAPARPPRPPGQRPPGRQETAWQRDGRSDDRGAQRRDDPRPGPQRREGSAGSWQRPGQPAAVAPRQPAAGMPAGDQRLRIEQRLRSEGWQRPDGRPRQAAPAPSGASGAPGAVRAPRGEPAGRPGAAAGAGPGTRGMPRPAQGLRPAPPEREAGAARGSVETRQPVRPGASAPRPAEGGGRPVQPGRPPGAAAPRPSRAAPAPAEAQGAPLAPRGGRGADWSSRQAAPGAAPTGGANRPQQSPQQGPQRGPQQGNGPPRQGRGDRR